MAEPVPVTNGASIVDAMVARYRRIRTYRDQGSVQTQLRGEPTAETTTFDTAFVAPDLFRFAFDRPFPHRDLRHGFTRTIVGCDGTRSFLHTQRPHEAGELEFAPDLAMAVAGATGISRGAAHTIARLLLPGMTGLALDQLQGLSLVGERQVDDVACHRLAGDHPSGGRWELLIEKESLLLRSLANEWQLQQRWAIRVDDTLDAATFAIPPAT